MNCRKCGNILNEGDMVCRICGEPVQAMNQPMAQPMNGGMPGGAMPTPQPTPTPMPTPQSTPGVAPQIQQPVMTPTPSQPVITPEMANSGMGMGQTIAPGQPQPMNMSQPMMQQPMNGGANMGAPKDNKTFKILIGVLLLVIIALGGFVAVKFIGGDKAETKETDDKKKEPTKTEKEPTKTEKEPEETEDSGNDPIVSEGNYFEYAGYKFAIPSDVKSQITSTTLMVSDGKTYSLALSVDRGISFDTVKTSPAAVAEAMTSEGFVAKDYEFKTYDGIEYFVLNVESDGQAGKLFYAELDDVASVMGMIVVKDETAYNTAFKISSKIIKTASATSSFAPGTDTTPAYKVSDDMKNIFKEKFEE